MRGAKTAVAVVVDMLAFSNALDRSTASVRLKLVIQLLP